MRVAMQLELMTYDRIEVPEPQLLKVIKELKQEVK